MSMVTSTRKYALRVLTSSTHYSQILVDNEFDQNNSDLFDLLLITRELQVKVVILRSVCNTRIVFIFCFLGH